MNFLAEESVDQPIVARLREEDHHVVYVAELQPGISDEEVLRLADQAAALLLTADKDFGEIVFRQGSHVHGVVLVRLAGLSSARKADIVARAVREHAAELARAFAVVMPGALRIRHVGGMEL